jgi:excisionase family DNA binding protein
MTQTKKHSKLVDATRLAQILNVTRLTIYRKVKRKDIPHYRLGREIRFDPDEVLKALRSGPDSRQVSKALGRF